MVEYLLMIIAHTAIMLYMLYRFNQKEKTIKEMVEGIKDFHVKFKKDIKDHKEVCEKNQLAQKEFIEKYKEIKESW